MLRRLLRASIRHRLLVLGAAVLLVAAGGYTASTIPVDVLPELVKPTVTVLAEAPGLSPEEVETLVTVPIEASLQGASGVTRVRSASTIGLAVVHAEFDWGLDPLRARQAIAERLAGAAPRLPRDVVPTLAPLSSLMGEILLVGLRSPVGARKPREVRTFAETTVRQRLQSVPGVSRITVMGGEVQELQVLVDPIRLRAAQVTLADVELALEGASANVPGGVLEHRGQDLLVRVVGRTADPAEIGATVVTNPDGVRIPISSLARVEIGGAPRIGDAGVNGEPGVVLAISRQPGVDTRELTARIEEAIRSLQGGAGAGYELKVLFRQASFIDAAIGNVRAALRDGVLLVALVLLLFLANLRTTLITLVTLPLSFAVAVLAFAAFGQTINTMTLGGLAIAVGALVDDAVVDVENVFRRLRENRNRTSPRPPLRVVLEASTEVRGSILLATFVVGLAALPLFALPGVEGRLFAPLGLAYLTAIGASLAVSLTVTPALCALLLPGARAVTEGRGDAPLVRFLKSGHGALLRWVLPRANIAFGVALVAVLAAAWMALSFGLRGADLLPPLNEGSATVRILTPAGTSLSESARIGVAAERLLLSLPGVDATGRRTGRAERDEHADGVHVSEIDVEFRPGVVRRREELLDAIRLGLDALPGVSRSIGQPIGHRLEHLLSGVEAPVVVKLFGPDLDVLRARSADASRVLSSTPGLVDVAVEPQEPVMQLVVRPRRATLAFHGVSPGAFAEMLRTALAGRAVGQIVEKGRAYDLVLRYDERSRTSPEAIRSALVRLPGGGALPLGEVADVEEEPGPAQVLRENGQRRVAVSCGVAGAGAGRALAGLEARLRGAVSFPSPEYFLSVGGPFRGQADAFRRLWLFALVALGAIALLLFVQFRDAAVVVQILVNVPLALIGSVAALAASGGSVSISIASLLGFLTVAGIASRNTILMVSHYLHLLRHEGESFRVEMIVRGSLERLVPVLMTAGTAALALVPLARAAGEPGKEILAPLAVVILGGLVSSTLLDLALTPALFWKFGGAAARRAAPADPGPK